ncbi:hypothetical protein [Phyllobacterium leguminum]|uniref:Uncharacterized protein n=1 Tax=Phyllobacterium leguminum TaxID=314237 RepID=A0A318TA11_9HYPH|nr:hypothetical protein [Phyllobacterium leguminum]PYE85158.1 hypothetical protein C7477_1392 [Phyllobacterium leguminum]
MSYKNGIFPERNQARKSQREEKFAQFFADLGLAPEPDPFAHEPDMPGQVAAVEALLAKAHGLHGDSKSAIEALQREVGFLRVGAPVLPTTSLGRPDINSCSVTAMTLAFFMQELG